jgi:PKD domain-containing protein
MTSAGIRGDGHSSRGSRWLAAATPALLSLLILTALAPLSSSAPSAASFAHPLARPADGVTLAVTGSSPGSISLGWSASTDLVFDHYEVDYSSSGSSGPWTVLATDSNVADTSFYWSGLAPGQTYWWQVLDYAAVLGATPSNVVGIPQPAAAQLSATLVGPTSANLNWTNGANYAGNVVFASYRILESANGGPYTTLAVITTASERSYPLNALGPGVAYAFYVNTTDGCSGAANCGSSSSSTTSSGGASFSTPRPLSVAAHASSSTIQNGTPDTFLCQASGGQTPYKFSWTFGDGTSASSAGPTHTYPAPGSYTAVCSVVDSFGSAASGQIVVTVSAPSGSSGSGGNNNSSGSGGGGGNGNGAGNSPGGSSLVNPFAGAVLLLILVVAGLSAAIVWMGRRRRMQLTNPGPSPPPSDAPRPTTPSPRAPQAGDPVWEDIPPVGVPPVGAQAASPALDVDQMAPIGEPPQDVDQMMDSLDRVTADSRRRGTNGAA